MTVACDETYQDVEKLIYRLAWNAVDRYGGEFDEYVSAGHLGYMKAYQTHDPSRGAFTTHLWHCVVNAITDVRRAKERDGRQSLLGDGDEKLPARNGFDLGRFLTELSEDAKLMVRAVVDSPGDLTLLLRTTSTRQIRRGLYQMLKSVGWSPARIIEYQQEVREALGLTGGEE